MKQLHHRIDYEFSSRTPRAPEPCNSKTRVRNSEYSNITQNRHGIQKSAFHRIFTFLFHFFFEDRIKVNSGARANVRCGPRLGFAQEMDICDTCQCSCEVTSEWAVNPWFIGTVAEVQIVFDDLRTNCSERIKLFAHSGFGDPASFWKLVKSFSNRYVCSQWLINARIMFDKTFLST